MADLRLNMYTPLRNRVIDTRVRHHESRTRTRNRLATVVKNTLSQQIDTIRFWGKSDFASNQENDPTPHNERSLSFYEKTQKVIPAAQVKHLKEKAATRVRNIEDPIQKARAVSEQLENLSPYLATPALEDFLYANSPIWQAVKENDVETIRRFAQDENQKRLLDARGVEGETIFHKACLFGHQELVDYLMSHHRDFVNTIYEGPQYAGEHAAHIFVARNDLASLKNLVAFGGDVWRPRANGLFFNEDGPCYYGETVLAFAVCLGRHKIVEYLLKECRVDPNSLDSNGNTPLHMLAWWGLNSDQLSELGDAQDEDADKEVLRMWDLLVGYQANPTIRNHNLLTPFLVAVARRNRFMVDALIKRGRLVQWSYGKESRKEVTAYLYPLTDIDVGTRFKSGSDKTEKEARSKTALEIAILNEDSDMIASQPIFRMVLEAKWTSYGQDMFVWYFISALLYMALYTVGLILLPKVSDGGDPTTLAGARLDYFSDGVGIARLVIELILVVANLFSIVVEIGEIKSRGWRDYFDGFDKWQNAVQWINIILFVIAAVLRGLDLSTSETAILGLLSIFGWLYLLYFSKGFQSFGPLCLIVWRMVFYDLSRFAALVSVFVLGFGSAIWLQLAGVATRLNEQAVQAAQADPTAAPDNPGLLDWRVSIPVLDLMNAKWITKAPHTALVWSARFLLSNGVYDDMREAVTPPFAEFLWIVYTVAAVVLLLNLLIAMLNTTYSSIIDEAEKNWRVQWAHLIMEMDDKLSRARRDSHRLGFTSFREIKRRGSYAETNNTTSAGDSDVKKKNADAADELESTNDIANVGAINAGDDPAYFFHLEFRKDTSLPTRVVTSDVAGQDIGEEIMKRSATRFGLSKRFLFGKKTESLAEYGVRET
ncbi:Transient receptor putative cation channel sub V member 6 [Quaeritorhiza haematococci]|nr:Transient receptor putative cation channel sub V member 6 [Quaeritorhiza haematococci]